MAVNKVEYKLASTTEGFAQAGDTVQIKLSNAKTIQKDVEEGCTEDLSNATQRFLDIRVQHSTEETDYEGGEEGGEDELGEEGESSEEKEGNAPGGKSGSGDGFGMGMLMGTMALHPFMNTFTAPGIGIAELAMGTMSIALTQQFDGQFNERMSEAAASGEYVSELQEYEEIMNTDIETMTEVMDELEAEEGAEGAEAEGEAEGAEEGATEDTGELESLQAELEQAQADGDEEKAAEIQAKIDEITAGLADGTEGAEDPVEEIQMNNESAHAAEEASNQAASFLHKGNSMGQLGVMNAAALAGSAANSVVLASEAWIGANVFTIQNSIVGSALSLAAAGTFTAAATMMTVKSVKEFNAASKGSDISGEINNMQDPLQQHDELIESLISKQDEQSSGDAGESGSTTGSEGSGASSSSAPASSTSSGGSSSGGSSSGGSSSTSA